MHLTSLSIHKLFGIYDYEFQFGRSKSGLTVITGPNGYGKTTILKIISSLNTSDLYFFYTLKFKRIELTFNDRSRLTIEKSSTDTAATTANNTGGSQADYRISTDYQVSFTWTNSDSHFTTLKYDEKEIKKAQREVLLYEDRTYRPHGIFTSPGFINEKDAVLYTPHFNRELANTQNQDGFLMQLELIRSKFISANRIYKKSDEQDYPSPIDRIINNIKEKLEEIRNIYNNESTTDDARFVNELLSTDKSDIRRQDYENICRQLQGNAELLLQYLSIKIEIPPFDESNKNILSYYVNRIQRKLTKCDSLLNKIRIFDEMLKSKKFADKSISYSPQHGIRIKSNSGDFIDASSLSSGEQNEIVMLYDMIFDLPDNSILLIDEPENSLHVAWQNMIISDLQRIADEKQLQVIIATHSPTIVRYGKEYVHDLYFMQKR